MLLLIFYLFNTAGFEWSALPHNAREAALAYTSLPSFFFPSFVSNPAGLTLTRADLFNLNYSSYLAGIQYGSLSYLKGGLFGYGGNLSYFTSGSIKRMTEAGESTGYFSFSSLFLTLSGSKRIAMLATGGNLKLIYANCDTFRSFGIGFDLGGLVSFSRANIGLLLKNFGFSFTPFYGEKDKLPLTFRFDAGYLVFDNLEISFGLEKFASDPVEFNFGAEANLMGLLFLRGSYSSLKDDLKLSGSDILANFAFGLSLQRLPLRLDYSFCPFPHLGNAHFFSLNFSR